jgi:hypothetical protein
MSKNLLEECGFLDDSDTTEKKHCPLCKNIINMKDFKDEISRREFLISGMCQKCQDDFFGSN